ncbi:hypothetical protein KQH61_03650 [bacterium]|nr:hypothetical protein [bacterium]MCB2178996.1 hypothetical protein [bacterium]
MNQHQTAIFIVAALLGFAFYLSRSIQYAQTIPSNVWDESGYVYYGWLFTSGKFAPFEDFGPWTNQMPVSYFLPGLAQMLFGVGLRSARYMSVLMGALTVLGLALAANRARSAGWAALIVWAVALNPGWVKAFSQVFSQGMVSFFFAWVIFFLVKKYPENWELFAAALLASLASMTRINVLPFTAMVVLYIWFAHGRKAGFWAILGAAIPFAAIHLLYWPDILKIWSYWIPSQIFPPIADYRSPWREVFVPDNFSWWPVSAWWNDPQHLVWRGIDALGNALRANFIAWFGVVLTLFLFPAQRDWKSRQDRELTIFFIISFFIMLAFHLWAALGANSCFFSCLPGYFMFFNLLGIFAVVMSAPSWKKRTKVLPYLIFLALCVLTLVAFEFQNQNDFRDLRYTIVADVLNGDPAKLQNNDTAATEPTGAFWDFLQEKTGFDSYRWLRFLWLNEFFTRVLWWIIPLTIVVLLPWGSYKLLHALGADPGAYRSFNLAFLLVFGAIFAGIQLFGQSLDVTTCDANIIDRQEEIGTLLAETIPAEAQIFWDVKSDIPLLYMDYTLPYMPQSHFRFTYLGDQPADQDLMQKYGWWNYDLGQEWITQSDYVVTENRLYDGLWGWESLVEAGEFDIVLVTDPLDTCTGIDSQLIVLHRIP